MIHAGRTNRGGGVNLFEKLKAEASGILHWLVEGFRMWRAEGLNPPDVVTAATDQYRRSEDLISQFIEAAVRNRAYPPGTGGRAL